MTLALNANAMRAAAQNACGIQLAENDPIFKRFNRLIDEFNSQARYTEHSLAAATEQCTERLIERLKLEQALLQKPEIKNEKIDRPVFVVGYARTGTTVMHSLLGEDASTRMPRFWEGHYPSVQGQPSAEQLKKADAACQAFVDVAPDILKAHPYWDMGGNTPIEDEEIFALDFHNAYPTQFYKVPFSPLDTAVQDTLDAYQFLKTWLQFQQYQQPAKRWICKGVMHQFCLDTLLEVFPDAICVWTHRDPTQFIPSTIGIYSTLYTPIVGEVDLPSHSQKLINAIRQGYDHILSQPWINDPRIIHVQFNDLLNDSNTVLSAIYARAELPWSSTNQANVEAWLANNKSDRHGKFHYTLEGTGLSKEDLIEPFNDYRARFALS